MPHLILVGLPGAGKSTVGSALARELGRTFLDFDAEIARREGMTIAEIFAAEGGAASSASSSTASPRSCGSSAGWCWRPGGGWVAAPETVALIRPPARMIYLRVRPRTALARMGRSVATRPLLGRPNPVGELERLLEERRAAYESADYVVDVERVAIPEVVRRIVAAMQP